MDTKEDTKEDTKIPYWVRRWIKNKSNPYPCPDCGKMINKSTIYNHKKTQSHKYAAMLKEVLAKQE